MSALKLVVCLLGRTLKFILLLILDHNKTETSPGSGGGGSFLSGQPGICFDLFVPFTHFSLRLSLHDFPHFYKHLPFIHTPLFLSLALYVPWSRRDSISQHLHFPYRY
jgi:hypothetical protein